MFARRLGCVLVAALAVGACGGRRSTLIEPPPPAVKVGDTTAQRQEAESAWLERGDKSKLVSAIAAWEAAEQLDPTDARIALKLSYAYYFPLR